MGVSSKESCDKLVTLDESDHLQPLDKRQRTSSVVEEHFQASASPTEAVTPAAGDRSPGLDVHPKLPPSSGPLAAEVSSATAEEPSSPSTPTRRPPFTRGRLRLLSFRSMEEARPVPTVKEKYPVLKDVMDFIKDQSLSHERWAGRYLPGTFFFQAVGTQSSQRLEVHVKNEQIILEGYIKICFRMFKKKIWWLFFFF